MRFRIHLDLAWVLVILLTVFAVAPLTYPGFFQVHSGFLSPFNVGHISDAPNWGRTADLLRGEGKLPYLLIWPVLQKLGSGVAAVKWGYALAFFLGALGTYAATRPWLGDKGGVLASAVYTYLPWHLGTVYVRGAYAEAWLWALWPFILWAISRWTEGHALPAALVGVLALAATLLVQPGLSALSLPLWIACAVVLGTRQRWPIWRLAAAMASTMLLLWAAAQMMPGTQGAFVAQFVYPFELLSAAWGAELSFQLGLAGVGLGIVALALWSSRKAQGLEAVALEAAVPARPIGRAIGFWLVALLLVVLFTLPLSASVWRLAGFQAFVTYPWQLLALVGLPLAFLAGSTIRLDDRMASLPAWAGLLALVVLASYPYLAPRFTRVDPGPEPVAMLKPLGADAPQIMLLEYEIAPPVEITPTLTVTLTWQAVEEVPDDYTVFVHVLAEGGTKVGQQDARPCAGKCPTHTWQPGEILVDRHEVNLNPDAPPGPYDLAMGLYLLETGERAAVVGRDDETVLLAVP